MRPIIADRSRSRRAVPTNRESRIGFSTLFSVATAQMAPDLEHLAAEEVLKYAVDRFHPRLTVACSFQKEASVVLDLLLAQAPDARVFTLDTHVLFPETYETWNRVEERYGIERQVFECPSLRRPAAT